MKDGPFKQALEQDIEGVVKQELITYKIQDGLLKKIVVTREYQNSGDYHDNFYSSPLMTMHWWRTKETINESMRLNLNLAGRNVLIET